MAFWKTAQSRGGPTGGLTGDGEAGAEEGGAEVTLAVGESWNRRQTGRDRLLFAELFEVEEEERPVVAVVDFRDRDGPPKVNP